MLASSIGGFVLSLIGIASVIRSNCWILIVLHVIFGLGYAYLLFLQPQSSEAKPRSPRKAKAAKLWFSDKQ